MGTSFRGQTHENRSISLSKDTGRFNCFISLGGWQKYIWELSALSFIKESGNVNFPTTWRRQDALCTQSGDKGLHSWLQSLVTNVSSLIKQLKEFHSIRKEAKLLFSSLCLRSNGLFTIITTNLSFDRWNEVFHETILTAALTDRLTHKAHLLNIVSDSKLLKEALELAKM